MYEWLVPEPFLRPEGCVAAFGRVVDGLDPGARVLDCAAGIGQLAVGLRLRGFDVVASDASRAMVDRTRKLASDRGVDLPTAVCRWEQLDAQGGLPASMPSSVSGTPLRMRMGRSPAELRSDRWPVCFAPAVSWS